MERNIEFTGTGEKAYYPLKQNIMATMQENWNMYRYLCLYMYCSTCYADILFNIICEWSIYVYMCMNMCMDMRVSTGVEESMTLLYYEQTNE